MLKRLFEIYLLASRWLLAPFLVMMTAGLVALLVKAAKKTYGFIELLLGENMVHLRVRIPFDAADLAALFHQRGIIEHEEFVEDGTVIQGRIAAKLADRLESFRIRPAFTQ